MVVIRSLWTDSGHYGAGWRPVRVTDQTGCGKKGFVQPGSRLRRTARPDGQCPLRRSSGLRLVESPSAGNLAAT